MENRPDSVLDITAWAQEHFQMCSLLLKERVMLRSGTHVLLTNSRRADICREMSNFQHLKCFLCSIVNKIFGSCDFQHVSFCFYSHFTQHPNFYRVTLVLCWLHLWSDIWLFLHYADDFQPIRSPTRFLFPSLHTDTLLAIFIAAASLPAWDNSNWVKWRKRPTSPLTTKRSGGFEEDRRDQNEGKEVTALQ